MGAGEETGCFSSPPSPRPRTGCCVLAGPPAAPRALIFAPCLSPTAAGADREAATPGKCPRAPSKALLSCSRSASGPVVHPVPPSKKSARPSVPPLRAPSRPRALPELSLDQRPKQKLEIKEQEPTEPRLSVPGTPEFRQGKKRLKERLPAWRNFYFLLLENEPENKLPVADSLPEFLSGSDT